MHLTPGIATAAQALTGHTGPNGPRRDPSESARSRIYTSRDLSLDAVTARAAESRALGRTPCDVCGKPATLFVRCDAESFSSFRCSHDAVIVSKQYHTRGLEVHAERLHEMPLLTTDASDSVAAIADMIEQEPFRFAIRFLNLEHMVEQLHARLGGAHT